MEVMTKLELAVVILGVAVITVGVYLAVVGQFNDWDNKPNLDPEWCMEYRTELCKLEYPTLFDKVDR